MEHSTQSWSHSAGCDRLCQETLNPALVSAGGESSSQGGLVHAASMARAAAAVW
ncbi:hypothetical protein [Synechococcus sp. CBW1107]|uniref:hypothetical protein n=1 Tax=Synechococcus sp. CBW1107 TaxID=2789857 RepID=UPI002AD4AA08|nr:hypothetical protein [Synechococcus sp. CBW1107]